MWEEDKPVQPSRRVSDKGHEILVVEDSPTQAALLTHLLTERGYAVRTAVNGLEALTAIKERRPSIVVSDITMPEMDGHTLCQRLKAEEALKDIPVVLLTSLSTSQDILKGLECGADNFICKPYEGKYLCSRLGHILINQELRKHDGMQMGVELEMAGKRHFITAERQQLLDLLISTSEETLRMNAELEERVEERTAALAAEIAERDKATAFVQLLQRVAIAANEAPTIEEALQTGLDCVCAHTRWPVGHVYLPAGDSSGELAPTTLWHFDNPERFETFRKVTEAARFAPGVGLPGRVLASGKPAWIIDVTKDSNFPRAKLAKDIGVKGSFGFPVLVGKEVVAVLEFFSEAVEPDQALLEVMAHVGTQLGRVIERKRAEESVQASEKELYRLFDLSTDLLFIGGFDGCLKRLNPAWEKRLGFTLEELQGKPFIELIHPEDVDATQAQVQRLAANQYVLFFENRTLCKDGSYKWFTWSGVPFVEEGVFYATGHDVTVVREAQATAEAANRSKSAFLAAMSHEIRTPMNGVVGMIDLLRETKLSLDQQEMMNTVRDSAFTLLHIIDDILDFSKIEAGKLKMESIPVSIRDVVEGVGETLASNAVKKDLQLELFIDPAIPEWVQGDQVRLRQILFNLAGNAIKFTSNEDGKRGQVWIRAEWVEPDGAESPGLCFRVRDNGIGMTQEAQTKLFQAFEQAESSTTRRFGGTGLGLSICLRLSKMMGGKIKVESAPGQGSEFTVTLPCWPAKEEVRPSDLQDLEGLKVQVVARDAGVQEILSCYLQQGGAEVEVVEDLEESRRRAEAAMRAGRGFDIVVLSGEWRDEQKKELREWSRDHQVLMQMRFVVLIEERGESAVQLDYPDSVLVRSNPMRRSSFLKGVAFAAGRASPEVKTEEELPSLREEEIPTLEEAEVGGELVLVAEDNLVNQDVILGQLNLLGYAAEIAGNGREALELWPRKKYGILLTDCHMPEMDGFELTGAIRETEHGQKGRFPIVAITANALKGEADRCLAAGMDDYLAKPVELRNLKQMMKKWLPRKAAAAEKAEPVAEGEFDPSALKELVGGNPALQQRFLKKFLDTTPANIQEIHAAYARHEASGVGMAAHKLKSSARTIGANSLADLCQALKSAGKSGNWGEIDALERKLDGLMARAAEHINRLLSRGHDLPPPKTVQLIS